MLTALEMGGVENWEGYEDACKLIEHLKKTRFEYEYPLEVVDQIEFMHSMFSYRMKSAMDKSTHDTPWYTINNRYLMEKLYSHVSHLRHMIHNMDNYDNTIIINQCVYVANHAMMIADNLGRVHTTTTVEIADDS